MYDKREFWIILYEKLLIYSKDYILTIKNNEISMQYEHNPFIKRE